MWMIRNDVMVWWANGGNRYRMHVVVANELKSRYDRVELVLAGGEERTILARKAGLGVRTRETRDNRESEG